MIQDTCEATKLPSVFFVWSAEDDIYTCRELNPDSVDFQPVA
jgi:hypothetical protein